MEDPIFPIPKLPNDLIIEILTWVPVKPLLKFKCVCKSWRTLISSNQFVRAHLQNSKLHPNFTTHRLIMTCGDNLKQCSLNSVLYEPVSEAFYLSPPLQAASFLVVGSCNGLLCLRIHRNELILWNPSTRIWKKLPDVNAQNFSTYYGYGYGYGFGFDKSNDDYKVVGFFYNFEDGFEEMIVQVYSLRNDQWRKIKSVAEGNWEMYDPAKFVNGKLYWIIEGNSSQECCWDIVSFDLEKEEDEIMQMPSYVKNGPCAPSGNCVRLGASGDSLLVLWNHGTGVDVWIMDCSNVGVGDKNWTKVVAIPSFDINLLYPLEMELYVTLGLILLHCGPILAIIDAKDCSLRYPEVQNFPYFAFNRLNTYLESLVSPLGY